MTGCLPPPKAPAPIAVNAGVDIVPPAVLASERLTPSSKPTGENQTDLIDVISQSELPHEKFLEVLRATGYVRILQQAGPYTIFAPTDDAFSKMPPGVLEKMLQPAEHDRLVSFVKYHLLAGQIGFSDLQQTNGTITTLAGTAVIVRGIDGKVMVNDANVIRTDTSAVNGVVQWVDGVLIPPG
jgi:uncharacterized surface protein with fasciclin (FAS1) repeats